MSALNFNANTVAPDEGFDGTPLPPGVYQAQIVESEYGPSKDQQSMVLKLVFGIIGGEFNDRKVFEYLTLSTNKNQKAAEIGQGRLSKICHTLNVLEVSDSKQLEWQPMMITLKVEPGKGDYGPSNRVTKFESLSAMGAAPQQGQMANQPGQGPGQTQQPPQTQPGQQGGTMPWQR